jgi:hypothetical protein
MADGIIGAIATGNRFAFKTPLRQRGGVFYNGDDISPEEDQANYAAKGKVGITTDPPYQSFLSAASATLLTPSLIAFLVSPFSF